MATDEYCTSWDVKISGRTVSDVTGGHNGAETRVGITYSEGVSKRGMSLQRFVDVTSTNAAKIMGMYPKKGALAAGSDADITVLDPAERRTVTAARLHEADYTPWEGYEAEIWPSLTVLRGKVMMEDGAFLGDVKDGKLLQRKIAEDIRNRPVL